MCTQAEALVFFLVEILFCLLWGNFFFIFIFCLKQIVLFNLHQLGEGKYGASTIT